MKIVHPICCGVDVHKSVIVATVAATGKDNVTTYETKTFSTINADLARFSEWLKSRSCFHACMESTGKYWIPVFNTLEADGVGVVLTHPKYVRAIKGKKTDKKDSKWIAGLFKHDMVRASFIPPKDIRALREISLYRFKLVATRTAEKCRYQNCMTVSNIGLASVLSDPFGKTATDIMGHVLTSDVFDEAHASKLIHKTAKKKTGLILESVRGCRIEPDQRFKMNEARAHMDYLDNAAVRAEAELFTRIQPHWHLVEHLSANLPGVSQLSATMILAETGADMSVFESAKHFTSWAGLAPANNESAGKKKSVRISKAGQYLKPLLVQCALAAVKSTREPYFAAKYQKLKKRRGHKKAIIAIARMMLTCIYHMISTGEAFNPSDYEECRLATVKKDAKTRQSLWQAVDKVENRGCPGSHF
ncbi:MAG: IS110 family transposase [Clostridiales bacterium]|nr:IS110 family transposase [Clostridiales bacterium]